jgi:hypothetical protein
MVEHLLSFKNVSMLQCVCVNVLYFLEMMFSDTETVIWSSIAFSDPLLTSHSIKNVTYNLIYFVG